MNIIAKNIVRRRKELKMTQKDLAERLHISNKTVSRWETGNQIPDALTIPEIARVLDMTIDELYGEEPDKKAQEENDDSKEDEDKKTETEAREYPNLKYGTILIFKVALLLGVFACFVLTTMAAVNSLAVIEPWMMIYGIAYIALGIYFFICEVAFYEFYKRRESAFYYEKENVKWFSIALIGVDAILTIWMPLIQTTNMYTYKPYLSIFVTIGFNLLLIGMAIWYLRRLKKKQYEMEKGAFLIPLLLIGLGIVIAVWYVKILGTSLTTTIGGLGGGTIKLGKLRLLAVLTGGIMTAAQIIWRILTNRIWKQKEVGRKFIQRFVTAITFVIVVCVAAAAFPYQPFTLYELLNQCVEEEGGKQYTIYSISFGG